MARVASAKERERLVTEYAHLRPAYERFADYICSLVGDYCGKSLVHATEHRAKSTDSFDKKCQRRNGDGEYVYKDPAIDITDKAAVRIIVFVKDSVDIVCQDISKILDVIEIEDVGDRVFSQGKFGYQSKHLLVRLGADRKHLVENSEFGSLVCEIQVRTILQHAWAEMEHDIQYKSELEIPLDLKKRFSALAGLLELADREFQNIQRDSDNLLRTVKDELINDLTQQGLIERSETSLAGDLASERSGTARELIKHGRYGDAIKIYTDKIAEEPYAHTLFIGRAKARFLAGETRGAISDLGQADVLSGDMSQTARLRTLIERGDDIGVKLLAKGVSVGLRNALEALQSGDGVRAFEEYASLEAEGYNKAFALFGKAMSCALEGDTTGARSFLQSLGSRPATPMAVNILALRAILSLIDGGNDASTENLLDARREVPNYSFDASPLNYSLFGLRARQSDKTVEIEEILALIGYQNDANAA